MTRPAARTGGHGSFRECGGTLPAKKKTGVFDEAITVFLRE